MKKSEIKKSETKKSEVKKRETKISKTKKSKTRKSKTKKTEIKKGFVKVVSIALLLALYIFFLCKINDEKDVINYNMPEKNEKMIMQKIKNIDEHNEIMDKNKKIIYDCDPGIDDEAALFLLSKLTTKPKKIYVSYGNASLRKTFRNAKVINKYFDINTDVIPGAYSSLSGEHENGDIYYGTDGLGEYAGILEKKYDINENDTYSKLLYDDMVNYIHENTDITYIVTGPLTNLAVLVMSLSDIKEHISNVYILGGGLKVFNWEHETEYNFWTDAEAVKKVLESGLNITIFPIDFGNKFFLTKNQIESLKEFGKYDIFMKQLEFMYEKREYEKGIFLYDAMPILYSAYPYKFKTENKKIIVDEYGHIEENENGNIVKVVVGGEKDILYKKMYEGMWKIEKR